MTIVGQEKMISFNESKIESVNRIIERTITNVTGLKFLSDKRISIPYGQVIQLNFYRVSSLNWCKLFGADKEEHHWKNIVDKKFHDSFRQLLYKDLNVNAEEYKRIRDTVKDFRDNYTSHREEYPCKAPCFTQALVACGTLSDVINGNDWFNCKLDMAKEFAKEQLRILIVD
jgi:hypothetical protein